MSKQQSALMKFNPLTGIAYSVYCRADAYRARYLGDAWNFNPWTGDKRDPRSVESDPRGLLIIPPGEPIYADTERNARPEPYTDTSPADAKPAVENAAPATRHLNLFAVVGEPTVEAITLISQIMVSYKDLPLHKKQAIAQWFAKAYGEVPQ